MQPTPESFRDRHGRVAFEDRRVVRQFDAEASSWFREVEQSGLFSELASRSTLVAYEVLAGDPLTVAAPRVPFVTYPYEWSYSMLRDAALVTLEVSIEAWHRGIEARDASAFNIVPMAGKALHVDLGSFRPSLPNYWTAYGQFCEQFLYPLALSRRSLASPASAWSSMDGVTARKARAALGAGRCIRDGLVRDLMLRAAMDRRGENLALEDRKRLRSSAGLPPSAIVGIMERLRAKVEDWSAPDPGSWLGYEGANTYGSADEATKRGFVSSAADAAGGGMAVDVGANTGRYSAHIAGQFESVVAIDSDPSTVDRMYQRVGSGEYPAGIYPVVADIMDPSPARGLLGSERRGLLDRLQPSRLTLWLAVLHHLVFSKNLPLSLFGALLDRLGPRHVVEFVGPGDPMVELLRATREEDPWPYGVVEFEAAIDADWTIRDQVTLLNGRRLYHIERREL